MYKNKIRRLWELNKLKNKLSKKLRENKKDDKKDDSLIFKAGDKRLFLSDIPKDVIDYVNKKSDYDLDFFIANNEEEIKIKKYLDIIETINILISIMEFDLLNEFIETENIDDKILNERIFRECNIKNNQNTILKHNFDDVITFSERYYKKYNKFPKKIIYNDVKKGFEIFI